MLKKFDSISYNEVDFIRDFRHVPVDFSVLKKNPLVHPAFFNLILITEGKHHLKIGNTSATLLPDDFILLFPKTTFTYDPHHLTTKGSYCLLTIDLYGKDSSKSSMWVSQKKKTDMGMIHKLLKINNPIVLNNFRKGQQIFAEIFRELEKKEIGYRSAIQGLLEELIIKVTRVLTRQKTLNENRLNKLKLLEKLLKENLAYPWTINEMATLTGFGVTTLTHELKHLTGFSPINYLINLRIEKALYLLRESNIKLTEIAFETGFYSSQHFSSTFKKVVGSSPSVFRRETS